MKSLFVIALLALSFQARAAKRNLQCSAFLQVDVVESGIYGLHVRKELPTVELKKDLVVNSALSLIDDNGKSLARAEANALLISKKSADVEVNILDNAKNVLISEADTLALNKSEDDSQAILVSVRVDMDAQFDSYLMGLSNVSFLRSVKVKSLSVLCNLR